MEMILMGGVAVGGKDYRERHTGLASGLAEEAGFWTGSPPIAFDHGLAPIAEFKAGNVQSQAKGVLGKA
jgi:hypothetical protein